MMNELNQKRIPLQSLFYLFSFGTLLFTVLSLVPVNNYFFDIISHFKLQCFVGSFMLGVISFLYRRIYLAMTLGVALLLNSFHVLPWYFSPGSSKSINKTEQAKTIKLYHANLLSSNKNYDQFFEQLDKENPDILLLQEISSNWEDKLAKLNSDFHYGKVIARPDNFGIAILSKFPLTDLTVKDWGSVGLPSFLTEISVNNQKFTLAYTHPLPPVNSDYYRLRDIQLSAMVDELTAKSSPLIIAGDFNLTMWSKSYQVFSPLQLKNTRVGNGLLSTWPSSLYYLGIPIDHILISKEFENIDTYTLGAKGSDHRAIISIVNFMPTKD